MRRLLWLHEALDPVRSGELRRLGVPAVALDGGEWLCDFIPAAAVDASFTPEVVVAPLRIAWAIGRLGNASATQVLIEIDSRAALARADLAPVLQGLSNRIVGAVARGPRAAAWASRMLGGRVPVWLAPDPAVRKVELAALAVRFGLPPLDDLAETLPDAPEVWFAEPGDHVEASEIANLARAWREPPSDALVVAPPVIRGWLAQAGVKARMVDWSPARLHESLTRAKRTAFFGAEGYAPARRRMLALRTGAPASTPTSPPGTIFEPAHVAEVWREILASIEPKRAVKSTAPSSGSTRVLAFLDLIQDLDPLLPVIDVLRQTPEVELRIVVSGWLRRRSPRVAAELAARRLGFEVVDRQAVLQGQAPAFHDTDALIAVAESSLPAHASTHALFARAQEAMIPTFAFQHGVENAGLHHVPGVEKASISADHLFVWFPPDRTPDSTPAEVRPRLLHVGRAQSPQQDLGPVAVAFANFETVVAVFENLHWQRYDNAWRQRFMRDCGEFALNNPHRAIILKPHHAGLWSVKNRHLISPWPANLIVADPTDRSWEPFTAAALVTLAHAVITTPSTAALDAAQARKPVAVAAYGLELPAYAPLALLQSARDWTAFLQQADTVDDARRRAAFLARTAQGDRPAEASARHILAAALARRRAREDKPFARAAAG
jgi:hypothetical protein